VKAHLRNTEQLLRNLQSVKNEELKSKILFSLDVAAIDTLRMCLEKEKKNPPLCTSLFQTCFFSQIDLQKQLFFVEEKILSPTSRFGVMG
jgi:hypothetical protein